MDIRLNNFAPELRDAAAQNPVLRKKLEESPEALVMMPVDQQTLGLTTLPSVDPILKGMSGGVGFGMPPSAATSSGTIRQGDTESKFSSRQDFAFSSQMAACMVTAHIESPAGTMALHEMSRCLANFADFTKTRWETSGELTMPGQQAPGRDNERVTVRTLPPEEGNMMGAMRMDGQLGDYQVALESRVRNDGTAVHDGYLLLPGTGDQPGQVLPFHREVKNPFAGKTPQFPAPGSPPPPVEFEGQFGNLKETGKVIFEPGKPIRVERDVGDFHIQQQIAHEYPNVGYGPVGFQAPGPGAAIPPPEPPGKGPGQDG